MNGLDAIVTDTADGPRTAEEFVASTVRKAILSGQLSAGSSIVQSELARRLGVSVTPVREALRGLAAERLVEIDPYRGAIVRGLSIEDVRDLNFLRRAIEPEVMRRTVANITESDLDEADEIQLQLRGEEDPARWTELNQRFHRVLLNAAGSELLVEILTGLQNSYAAYIVTRMMAEPQGMSQAAKDHDHILAAIRRRDTDVAIESTISHMRFAVGFMEKSNREPVERVDGAGTASGTRDRQDAVPAAQLA